MESANRKCIICRKSKGIFVNNPTEAGIKKVIEVAKQRNDKVHSIISRHLRDDGSLEIDIHFHSSCRAIYTCKRNVLKAIVETPITEIPNELPTRTRINEEVFQIRRDCFICSKVFKKREKLTLICTGSGQTTHDKVLRAAKQRQDHTVINRMDFYKDLFAYDARYHRSCLAHYISDRNIKSAKPKSNNKNCDKGNEIILFFKNIEDLILNDNSKQVFAINDLYNKYKTYIIEKYSTDHERYSVNSFKVKIKAYFGQNITWFERPGKPTVICPSHISARDFISNINQLNTDSESDSDDESINISKQNDIEVLHKASQILRECIKNEVSGISSYFYSKHDMEIENVSSFVPELLLKFVSWLVDNTSFTNLVFCPNNIKIVYICHQIISQNLSIQTPLLFGLGIVIHHETGSKNLVNTLNSFGLSTSYDYIRKYTTALAADQINIEGVYIPRNIGPVVLDDSCTIIDAAIDNFDMNEETLTGKNTTHSMAMVLYQRSNVSSDVLYKIQTDKSVKINYTDNEINKFITRNKNPQPNFEIYNEKYFAVQHSKESFLKYLLWTLLYNLSKEQITWDEFLEKSFNKDLPITKITYLPFIDGPPTDISTIYTALTTLANIATHLKQNHILVTADLAIYSKAQHILWQNPELSEKVTMRLGNMHLIMTLIASIGNLFGDGGLFSILTGSGLLADASARMVLQGKQYYRGVRCLKIVLQALHILYIESAERWASENSKHFISKEMEEIINSWSGDVNTFDVSNLFNKFDNFLETLAEFNEYAKSCSATFSYWFTFMKAVHVVLRLIEADRKADFELHLNPVLEALPFFFVANRHNYAKYVPIYVSQMRQLKNSQPIMYEHLCNGGFVVRKTANRKANAVATDMALEQSINKDAKGKGGIVGFTLKKEALLRWLLTRHLTGEFSAAVINTAVSKSTRNSYNAAVSRQYYLDLQKVESVLREDFCNPFDINLNMDSSGSATLINIATGEEATDDVRLSLTTLYDQGNEMMKNHLKHFKNSKASFWDPIKKSNIKSFTTQKREKLLKQKTVIAMDSELMFRRLLAVSKLRGVNLRNLVRHEMAPIPPALFNEDGTMRKTKKSDLAAVLQCYASTETDLESCSSSAFIVDGMAKLQSISEKCFKTFEDIGKLIMRNIIFLLRDNKTVVYIFDRYDVKLSIKQMERQRRGNSEAPVYKISAGRNVPNYKLFMKNNKNKAQLANFVSNYVRHHKHLIPEGRSVILAGALDNPNDAVLLNLQEEEFLTNMSCVHEEADTTMIFHLLTLQLSHERIIVSCQDTDVLILLIYYCALQNISSSLYMFTGKSATQRYIHINKICNNVGIDICLSLPSMHALTGCDTTSALYGIGKKTAYTVLKQNKSTLELDKFGTASIDDAVKIARRYVLLLYKSKSCKDLDDLRYNLLQNSNKAISNFPPTEDSFIHHVKRSLLQVKIWCNSHDPSYSANPVGMGWSLDGNYILPVMSVLETAPKEVRELTHLYCKDKGACDTLKCECFKAGLKCIDICKCALVCNNTELEVLDPSSDEDEF